MAELLNESIKKIRSGFTRLSDQFTGSKKYYNPTFDFYSTNTMKKNDKGAIIELESRVRSEVVNKITHWQKTVHKTWTQAIKDYQLSTVDRAIQLRNKDMSFLTNEKQPIIKTYTDRVVGGLFDGEYGIKVYSTRDDETEERQMQGFVNWIYSSSNMRNTMLDVGVDSVLLGNGFYKTGFKPMAPKDKKNVPQLFKIDKKNQKELNTITEVQAVAEYISPFSLFLEPYQDFYDQQAIHRDYVSFSTFQKRWKDYFTLTDDQIAIILGSPQPASLINFNRIKLIKYYEDLLISNDIGFTMNDFYKVKLNDDLIEEVTLYDGKNLVIMVNGYICYDHVNPYYYEGGPRHPFKNVSFTRTPGSWLSQGVGVTLAGQQKLYDAMFNIMFDLAKFTAGPMFLLQPGQVIEGNEHILNYEPFTFKRLRGAGDAKIETLDLPKPDQVNFKMMADILDMANLAVAPTSYNQVEGVSRSATDSEYRKQGLKDSLKALSESFAETFTKSVEDYMMYAKEHMPEKFKVMFIKDGKKIFEEINKTTLSGNFIYETEFESFKDIEKIVDRNQYIQLMDIIQRTGQDPVTGKWLVNMKKLLTRGFQLFNTDKDMLLSDDEYKGLITDMEKTRIDVQSMLQDYAKDKQQITGEGEADAIVNEGGQQAPEGAPAGPVPGPQQIPSASQILQQTFNR